MTNATIRRDLTALSRLLAACVSWGWRTDNPARDDDRFMVRERRDPITLPGDREWALLRSFFEKHGIALRLATHALRIDREAARVLVEPGGWLGYDRLVLATGARNRPLALPGAARRWRTWFPSAGRRTGSPCARRWRAPAAW